MKHRVKIHHRLRESICIDIETDEPDTLVSMASALYAEACALKGWGIDWKAPADFEMIETLGHADAFDTLPDAVLRIAGDRMSGRTVELVDEHGKLDSADDVQLRSRINKALDTVKYCCVDNTEDRRRIVEALIRVLR